MSNINYLYHSVECENVKVNYTEYDTLDFNLDFEGRALVCGSIRLEASIEVLDNAGGVLAGTERIACDHMIGGHSVVSSAVSTIQNIGIIENATELPRYVSMVTNASEQQNDLLQAKYVCELRSPDKKLQEKLMMPKCPADMGGGASGQLLAQHLGSGMGDYAQYTAGNANPRAFVDPDFSIKPHIALNRVVGSNNLLNYSKTGTIKLSFNLARNQEVLYGEDMNNHTYRLKDARVCFVSVPQTPNNAPVNLRATLCLKSNVNSNLSNQSSRVPAICDSCSLSFIRLNREISQVFNNTALERPPNISKLRFMFNDSTSKYITYELDNQQEILAEGIKALNEATNSNNIRLDKLNSNKSFVAGLKFGEQINLQNQKFNIQIESGVSTARPFLMFAYFHSLLTM